MQRNIWFIGFCMFCLSEISWTEANSSESIKLSFRRHHPHNKKRILESEPRLRSSESDNFIQFEGTNPLPSINKEEVTYTPKVSVIEEEIISNNSSMKNEETTPIPSSVSMIEEEITAKSIPSMKNEETTPIPSSVSIIEEEIINNNIPSTKNDEEIIDNSIPSTKNDEEIITNTNTIPSTKNEETTPIPSTKNEETTPIPSSVSMIEEEMITNTIPSTKNDEEIITNTIPPTKNDEEIITNTIPSIKNEETTPIPSSVSMIEEEIINNTIPSTKNDEKIVESPESIMDEEETPSTTISNVTIEDDLEFNNNVDEEEEKSNDIKPSVTPIKTPEFNPIITIDNTRLNPVTVDSVVPMLDVISLFNASLEHNNQNSLEQVPIPNKNNVVENQEPIVNERNDSITIPNTKKTDNIISTVTTTTSDTIKEVEVSNDITLSAAQMQCKIISKEAKWIVSCYDIPKEVIDKIVFVESKDCQMSNGIRECSTTLF